MERNPMLDGVNHVRRAVCGGVENLKEHLGKHIAPVQSKAAQIFTECSRHLATHTEKWLSGGGTRLAFASLSGSVRRAQPMFSLAMNPEELKARVSAISVYAVTNKKNEFVLMSSEASEDSDRVALLFMCPEGAQELIDKLKKDDPKLGRSSKVVCCGLDSVFDLLTLPRYLNNIQGVVFRFVPDMKEVAHAMEVFKSAGVPTRSITGVPIFQAEGLTVQSPEIKKATPLFLSKDDLDAALQAAGKGKVSKAELDLRKKLEEFEDSAREARQDAQAAEDEGSIKKFQQVAKKADARAVEARKRLDKLSNSGAQSRVEVGCLEDVLGRMDSDTKGTWSNVVFVQPGVITERLGAKAAR